MVRTEKDFSNLWSLSRSVTRSGDCASEKWPERIFHWFCVQGNKIDLFYLNIPNREGKKLLPVINLFGFLGVAGMKTIKTLP